MASCQRTLPSTPFPYSWSCSTCTLTNSVNNEICSACGSTRKSRPDIEIIEEIENISLEPNVPNSKRGRAMEKRRESKTSLRRVFGEILDNSSQSVPDCTPLLEADTSETQSLKETVVRSWGCALCTYQNLLTSILCGVCGHGQPSNGNLTKERINRRKSNDPRGPVKNAIIETYSDIVEACWKTDSKFVDDAFPPAQKSLYFNGKSTSTAKRSYDEQSGQVIAEKWLRPNDIKERPTNSKVKSRLVWTVTRNPVPSDICQGKLGNCWFIGALALIAEREELLDNILKTKEIHPSGAYIVRLCKDGKWTDVIVDDLFPCDSHDRLIYSKGKRMQLWVPLIEKAMAKLHGCYEALISGHLNEGLMALTGFPCEKLMLLEKQDVDMDLTWMTLLSYHSAGFLMGAASGDYSKRLTDEEYAEKGLVRNHVYSVLNIVDLSGHRLIQLRNPWGHFCWKGDWSDNSACWTPKMRRELQPKKDSEGVFWISFQDFSRYFYTIEVCKIRKDWDFTSFQGIFVPYADVDQMPFYTITVDQTTELDITLYQNSGRETNKEGNDVVPGDLQLMLFKAGAVATSKEDCIRKGTLIQCTPRERKRMVQMNCILDPGKYYLIPLSVGHWTDDDNAATYPGFEIAIYSSRRISSSQVPCPPNNYLLADAIIALALIDGVPNDIANGDKGVRIYSNRLYDTGCIFVIENQHKDKWVVIETDLTQSSNIVCTRGSLKTIDCLPPRSRQVINLLTSKDVSRYALSTKFKWSSSSKPGLSIFGGKSTINHDPSLNPRNFGLHTPRQM